MQTETEEQMVVVDNGIDVGGRILVVDDQPHNRELLHSVLTFHPHEVLEAESGEQALEILAREAIDLVLLDIMMPKIDGFEVCRRIKSDPRWEAIPVILVTALTGRKDRIAGIEAGANDFLTKPVDVQDVTLRVRNALRQKRLHDRLQESFLRLKDLEEQRDNLVGMVVHDMRAPLMGVSGNLTLLKDMGAGGAFGDEAQELVESADSSTRRLMRMTDNLLAIRALEEKTLPLSRSECSLEEVVQAAIADCQHVPGASNIHVVSGGQDVVLSCDAELLQRLVINLLTNALTLSPQHGRVTIGWQADDETVRLEVGDEGPGVLPEERTRIFEPFYRGATRPDRDAKSFGLGLAFCRLAIEAHSGSIGVEEGRDGVGSLFWCHMPKRDAKQSESNNLT